jgi:inner membrane protein
MLIGHIPASYLWTRKLQQWRRQGGLLWLGLLAGVLPDVDMLYYYLVDGQQRLHHTYWTHVPFYWLVAGGVSTALLSAVPSTRLRSAAAVLFSNVFLHLILDTVAGGIQWLYPASERLWRLLVIPRREGHWALSFVLHWTFLLELALCAWAGGVLWRSRTPRAPAAPPTGGLRSSEQLSIFTRAR